MDQPPTTVMDVLFQQYPELTVEQAIRAEDYVTSLLHDLSIPEAVRKVKEEDEN